MSLGSDTRASRLNTGCMVENIAQFYILVKGQQNETPAKDTIKVLFMYIMIHKLDLYINIAFHPTNQNCTLSVKKENGS